MQKVEEIVKYLEKKGWIIQEDTSTKTLITYLCCKGNVTSMEMSFIDKADHTLKKGSETALDAIKVKSIKEIKNIVISRKEDMINDLVSLSKIFRVDIIYAESKEDDVLRDTLLLKNFKPVMKNFSEEKYLRYFTNHKLLGACRSDLNDKFEKLQKYQGMFREASSDRAEDADKQYRDIISKNIYTLEDLYFIYTYLSIVKDYYEVQNKDYGNIYEDEYKEIISLLDFIQRYID